MHSFLYGSDQIFYTLGDHQQTIHDAAKYISSANATKVVTHRYGDAWGTGGSYSTFEGVSFDGSPFAYTGRYLDTMTGLQWNLNRWYDPMQGRWMSEDPIGFEGDPFNLYRYVGNSPTNYIDPFGTNAIDYFMKLRGGHVYKAYGGVAGGVLQLATWITDDVNIQIGAQSGIYFYPDTCEIGLFSIKMGIVKALDPNGGPPKIDFEGGVQAGLGLSIEYALFTGPGWASAESFSGIFYTGQGGGGPVGFSGYKGEPLPNGAYWYGGTIGVGVGLPLQVGTVAWNYQLIASRDLDDSGLGPVVDSVGYCECLALTLAMP